MKRAPVPRPDGLCVVCEKPRRRPSKGHKSALAAWERDPFCTTECAKRFHGATVEKDDGWQAAAERRDREFDDAFEAA